MPDGMPQAEELDVVVLDEADASQVLQFIFFKLEGAKIIDLSVYLIEHLLSEDNAFVSALEEIFPYKVGVLVKDDLVHIEFIQVCVKKTLDDRFQFHVYYLLSGSGPVFSFYIVSLMICKIQLYFYHVIIFVLK